MSEETTITNPHNVLETGSSSTTSALPSPPILSPQRQRESILKKRKGSIDLRIGLNLLGEQGRKLLAEYITIKRHRTED